MNKVKILLDLLLTPRAPPKYKSKKALAAAKELKKEIRRAVRNKWIIEIPFDI